MLLKKCYFLADNGVNDIVNLTKNIKLKKESSAKMDLMYETGIKVTIFFVDFSKFKSMYK